MALQAMFNGKELIANGKNYANRKPKKDRPYSDYYPTPKSLTWKLLETGEFPNHNESFWEPACGKGAISTELWNSGIRDLVATDINMGESYDFLKEPNIKVIDNIITNPPFSLFDEFVIKAKQVAKKKVAMIAKVNFFGATGRAKKGVWDHLSHVYLFDRQVDYRTPEREDGLLHVGNLVTGWFIWDMDWKDNWWKTEMISVQEYAKLGQVKL